MSPGKTPRTLSTEQARAFYNRFGEKQDQQGFYEQVAIDELCDHASFDSACAVLELGCGTGKFAARLLLHELKPGARYLGLDVSETMVKLAHERISAFGDRARICQTNGSTRFEVDDASFDRLVSCYVFDLLSQADILAILDEAHRVLVPGGLLCTAGLTHGITPVSSLVSRAWSWLQSLHPTWVGGCRPIELGSFLSPYNWKIEHRKVVSAFGVPSEVVIAKSQPY